MSKIDEKPSVTKETEFLIKRWQEYKQNTELISDLGSEAKIRLKPDHIEGCVYFVLSELGMIS